MGIPTGLQFSITAIGSMVMQSANNGLGSVYVSAFTAAMKIKQFMMCPFDADRIKRAHHKLFDFQSESIRDSARVCLSVSAMVRLRVSS